MTALMVTILFPAVVGWAILAIIACKKANR